MILLVAARTEFQRDRDPSSSSSVATFITIDSDNTATFKSGQAHQNLLKAIPFAHRSAQIIRDLRQTYGLKISPAWLLQLQAVAVGVLLQDPALTETIPTPPSSPGSNNILDSHTAFDEIFRSLLGTGVGVMIARGIARMTYHSALRQRAALSKQTRGLLKVMSETAWRLSDLGLLKSSFPNFANVGEDGRGESGKAGMTDLLRKWERLDI